MKKNTVYEGGVFRVDMELPTEYPYQPPRCRFMTKIYHPNIGEGEFESCIVGGNWTPILRIRNIVFFIIRLLEQPDLENPLNAEIAV
jgi:ubiquitin-protein ligase